VGSLKNIQADLEKLWDEYADWELSECNWERPVQRIPTRFGAVEYEPGHDVYIKIHLVNPATTP
jgi:hypothetical protein